MGSTTPKVATGKDETARITTGQARERPASAMALRLGGRRTSCPPSKFIGDVMRVAVRSYPNGLQMLVAPLGREVAVHPFARHSIGDSP